MKSICEKAQELPNLLTVETISDYRDNNDSYTDPNIEAIGTQDNVDHSDDEGDVAMDTGQLPQLHVSEGEDEVDSSNVIGKFWFTQGSR